MNLGDSSLTVHQHLQGQCCELGDVILVRSTPGSLMNSLIISLGLIAVPPDWSIWAQVHYSSIGKWRNMSLFTRLWNRHMWTIWFLYFLLEHTQLISWPLSALTTPSSHTTVWVEPALCLTIHELKTPAFSIWLKHGVLFGWCRQSWSSLCHMCDVDKSDSTSCSSQREQYASVH